MNPRMGLLSGPQGHSGAEVGDLTSSERLGFFFFLIFAWGVEARSLHGIGLSAEGAGTASKGLWRAHPGGKESEPV